MELKEGDVYMNEYRFSVYVTRNGEDWTAVCPDFPDCRTNGPTREEALSGLREVIRTFVEDGLGDDELPPCRHGRDACLLTVTC